MRREFDIEKDKLLSLLSKVELYFSITKEIRKIISTLKDARSITVVSHKATASFSQKTVVDQGGRRGQLMATSPKSATLKLEDGTETELVTRDLLEKNIYDLADKTFRDNIQSLRRELWKQIE